MSYKTACTGSKLRGIYSVSVYREHRSFCAKNFKLFTTVEIYNDRIEMILEDTGPGIPDIELAMSEGYSTAQENIRELGFGAGMGLPNMKKYTDELRIETELGVGTTVYMKVLA